MTDTPTKAAVRRILRYVVVPALLVALDAIAGYLQAGRLDVDWRVVVTVTVTALLAGLSKWAREELAVDLRII